MTEEPKGLESKWWYRLLRVILLPLYGLVLIVASYLIYDRAHPRPVGVALVVCDDGKTFPRPLTSLKDQVARSLCTYGDIFDPGWELTEPDEEVVMPDGVLIQGVPHGTSRSEVTARYQRWRSQVASQARQPKPTPKVILDFSKAQPIPKPQTKVTLDFSKAQPLSLQFVALHDYTEKVVLKTRGTWGSMLSYMAIAWLLIHLPFVAIRGAVLYVAVGRFLPVSGLRGWLVL